MTITLGIFITTKDGSYEKVCEGSFLIFFGLLGTREKETNKEKKRSIRGGFYTCKTFEFGAKKENCVPASVARRVRSHLHVSVN